MVVARRRFHTSANMPDRMESIITVCRFADQPFRLVIARLVRNRKEAPLEILQSSTTVGRGASAPSKGSQKDDHHAADRVAIGQRNSSGFFKNLQRRVFPHFAA
jgi:hypothetical protein